MLTANDRDATHLDSDPPGHRRDELGTSVGKAMSLLTAFDRSTPIGVSELARKADIPKSTAFRLLTILERFQFVERVESRYRLGTKLFELGNQVGYCCPRSLREVAHPYLEELRTVSQETAQLAILEGGDVLYLDKLFGHNHVRTPSHVGRRVPAHAAALGKVLLAHSGPESVDAVLARRPAPLTRYTIFQPQLLRDELESIRQSGVAFDREEVKLGLVCVAAVVRDRRNQTVAAISVSGQVGRFHPERMVSHVDRAANAIGQQLQS